MKRRSHHVLFVSLILLLSSCKGSAGAPPPVVSSLPNATTITLPTVTHTPVPLINISQNSECHSGPGNEYDVIDTLNAGDQIEAIGRSTDQAYWIIRTDEHKECWIDSQFVQFPIDDISFLPEFTPPLVPTPAAPVAPSELNIIAECEPIYEKLTERDVAKPKPTGVIIKYTLTWKDNANDEMGYQLMKNDESFLLLPPDTTSYIDTISFPTPTINYSIEYGVAAYNGAGQSTILEMEIYKVCSFLN